MMRFLSLLAFVAAFGLMMVQCTSEKQFDRERLEAALDTAHTLAGTLDALQKTINAHLVAIDLGRVALTGKSDLKSQDQEVLLEHLQEINTAWNLHRNQAGEELDRLARLSQTLAASVRLLENKSAPTPIQWTSYDSIAPELQALQHRLDAFSERIGLSRAATRHLLSSDPLFGEVVAYLNAAE